LSYSGSLDEEAISELNSLETKDVDLVLDLSLVEQFLELDALLAWREAYSEKKKSAILLVPEEKMEFFGDEEIPMAPTWQECLDLIEMERIERALGF
jgi:hypothetical protein